MAHPRRFVALDRKALTVGLTAALLTVPMAGVSGAVTLDTIDSIDTSTLTAVELEILESEGVDALRAHMERVEATAAEPVKETVAPVVDAVEKTVREVAPAPVAQPAPEKDKGGATIAGSNDPQPVSSPSSQPASSTAPSSATTSSAAPSGDRAYSGGPAIAPAVSNELRATSGFSSSTERPNLQPAAPAPLVSSPFMVQAPQVSGEAVQTPLTALAAAPDFVSSVVQSATATPLSEHPSGVPGALTATAAALLLMVGAGHVLHRNGDLRRTFAG